MFMIDVIKWLLKEIKVRVATEIYSLIYLIRCFSV